MPSPRGFTNIISSLIAGIAFFATLVGTSLSAVVQYPATQPALVIETSSTTASGSPLPPAPLATSSPHRAGAQSTTAVSSAPANTTTVIYKYITEPAPATSSDLAINGSGVTEVELTQKLQELNNELQSQIASITAAGSTMGSGGIYNEIAASNRIDKLSGTTLTNVTVSGISGLTLSDIPDLSSRYLSVGGGTITGLSSFTNASTTELSAYGPAYFGAIATSSFASNGALTLAQALGVGSGGTGWGAVQSGALLYGNGSSALATTSAGTPGQVLALLNGIPTWTATTTFSTGLSYNNGAVTNAGVLSLAQNGGGSAETGALTLATSSQSFNGLTDQLTITNSDGTFALAPTLSGTLNNTGLTNPSLTVSAGSGLSGGGSVSLGGSTSLSLNTGNANMWTTLQQFQGNASTTEFSAYGPAYFGTTATSSFSISGALTLVSNGLTVGTNQFVVSGGNVGIGTTSPYALLSIGNTNGIGFTTATSTFNTTGGVNLSSGCYAVNGTCLSTGSTLNGSLGQAAYFSGSDTAVGTSSLIIAPDQDIGIGTSTPGSLLSLGSLANFTTSTSTFYSSGGINLTGGGCFAVNGKCISDTVVRLSAIRVFSSGTNVSYTPPAAAGSYLVVEAWGGGGGGGGADGSAGTAGGSSCFGTNSTACTSPIFSASGGSGGGGGAGIDGVTGGAGGSAGTGNGGNINLTAIAGSGGGNGCGNGSCQGSGGAGGSAAAGGGVTTATGISVGGGGGTTSGSYPGTGGGGGGGGGGYSQKFIAPPLSATYYYTVGNGGSAGSSSGDGPGSAGTGGGIIIYEYTTVTSGTDVAENYPVTDPTIAPGDIVSFDGINPIVVDRAIAGEDTPLAGVISTQPGLLLTDAATSTGERPVALSGRVPTKVNLEGGPINIGDRVALSSVPGVGRKAGLFEPSVGIALEPYDGTETSNQIAVFINLQPGIDISALEQQLLSPVATSTATSTSLDFVSDILSGLASRIISVGTSATTSTTSAVSTAASSSASDFLSAIESTITGWLADAANGIQNLYAAVIHSQEVDTQKLCVGQICIDQAQLAALLASEGQATPSSVATTVSTTTDTAASSTPPVIQLNGENPAIIEVGSTYSDLGAAITGPSDDLNLGIHVSVDGGATTTPDQIAIDTSKVATHVIEYFATDQNGLTGYATRTVTVEAASSTLSDSSSGTSIATSTSLSAATATTTASTTSQ